MCGRQIEPESSLTEEQRELRRLVDRLQSVNAELALATGERRRELLRQQEDLINQLEP